MKRRRLLLILLGCVASITLAIVLWPREPEPQYNGVSLSTWLKRYNSSREQAEASEAIRHIGTNALPYLVKWIQYETPGWRYSVERATMKLPSAVQDNRCVQWLLLNRAEYRAGLAINGFEILGPEAKPAWADLYRLSNNNKSAETARRAWICMANVATHSPPGDFDRDRAR